MSQRPCPYLYFSVLGGFLSVAAFVAAYLVLGISGLGATFLALNVAAFTLMGLDKSLARSGALRVPEAVLLSLAIVGGTPAIIVGSNFFWHKIRSSRFQFYLCVIFVFQVLIWTLLSR